MKVALIHGTSQKNKNKDLFDLIQKNTTGMELVNLGCFEDETLKYSYIDVALQICLLINSGAVDFCITGCSSGQGVALACNAMPGLMCGYCPRPEDAFLFGRINDGNVMALPLGLNYGWCSEINIGNTIKDMFNEKLGIGYPPKDAERKKQGTALLKNINSKAKLDVLTFVDKLEKENIDAFLSRKTVVDYIIENGTNKEIVDWVKNRKKGF